MATSYWLRSAPLYRISCLSRLPIR